MTAFRTAFASVLQDPEYPFDFCQEDLQSKSRSPIYRPSGRPVPSLSTGIDARGGIREPEAQAKIRPKFEFDSLPSCPAVVRLVVLHASASPESIIACSQYVETLDNHPSYIALSYNWYYGELADETILINGRECSIRANLAAALRELRRTNSNQLFWIDAVCMSMNDLTERGAQVRMMDRIYHCAEAVVVWLGPGPSDIDDILGDMARHTGDVYKTKDDYTDSGSRYIRRRLSPRECVENVFENVLWSKTWIVLEVVLAGQTVIAWGHHRVPWSSLVKCAGLPNLIPDSNIENPESENRLFSRAESRLSPWEKFEIYERLRRNWADGVHLSVPELMFQTRHFEVSEGKDKIMTMIHLLHPHEREEVITLIDYNLSYVEMTTSVAEYCLRKTRSLNLLSVNNLRDVRYHHREDDTLPMPLQCRSGQWMRINDLSDLPSWAPAWSCAHWSSPLVEIDHALEVTHMPLSEDGIKNDFVVSNKVLHVQGVILDEVEGLVRSWLSDQSIVNYEIANSVDRDRATSIEDSAQEILHEHHSEERSICVFGQDRFALVPAWSKTKDMIVAIYGGPVAYVLREVGGCQYRLVGDWQVTFATVSLAVSNAL